MPPPRPLRRAPTAKITIDRKDLNVRAGRTAYVRGTLLPAPVAAGSCASSAVQRGRWRQIDGDLTRASGRFALRYRTHAADTSPVRVRFGGDGTREARARASSAA